MKSIFTKIPVLLLMVSFVLASWGQEDYRTIYGKLKDARTGEKISYASITVPNTGIGTVSNSDGEFILKIDTLIGADYFEVSHVSYSTAQFKISGATGKEGTYYLELRPVQLKEIPILPDDARSLVAMAFRNIRNNYSQDPNMMTGFYRESIAQNRDYISISEAVVDIYKAPYNTFESDQVRIFKGRKSSGVKKADTLLVKLQGGPNVLLLLDLVKNPDLGIALSNLDNYRFEFAPVVNIDDKLNWVVSFSPAVVSEEPLYYGKIYISQDDMAVTRAEFSLDLSDPVKASAFFVRKKPAGLLFHPISTGYLVTYKEQDYKYYLSYMRVDLKFRCDWKRRLFKDNFTLVSEMAITGRTGKNIVKFHNEELFRQNMIFTEKVQDFSDIDFWGEHNIIEPEKSIEEAIRKISKKAD